MGEADSLVVDVEASKSMAVAIGSAACLKHWHLTTYRTLRLVRLIRWPVISAPVNVVSVALTVDPLRIVVARKGGRCRFA